jgi:hypothetical protein
MSAEHHDDPQIQQGLEKGLFLFSDGSEYGIPEAIARSAVL